MVTKENIQSFYKEYGVSPKRAEHSLGVAEIAVELAENYGIDTNDAWVAGALHDLARDWSKEKIFNYCRKFSIKLNSDEEANYLLVHGKVSAHLAVNELGINDRNIKEAIGTHTTGKPEMTILQKIIYIADFLRSTRNILTLAYIKEESIIDLNKTVSDICIETEKFLNAQAIVPSKDFLDTKDYYSKVYKS